MVDSDRAARFWAQVDRTGGPDACWPWTGSLDNGYGTGIRLEAGQRQQRAHRCAYIISIGPIPSGAHVLHSCDNPPCCNPAHLSAGSHAENMRQMSERRRSGTVGRRRTTGSTKLTPEQADEIRRRYRPRDNSPQLAAEFGISVTMVWKIGTGRDGSRQRANAKRDQLDN